MGGRGEKGAAEKQVHLEQSLLFSCKEVDKLFKVGEKSQPGVSGSHERLG